MSSDTDKMPIWDTQMPNLRSHLIVAERWLLAQDSRFAPHIEHGISIDRGQTIVSDINMIPDIKARSQLDYSFEDPFPVTNPSPAMRNILTLLPVSALGIGGRAAHLPLPPLPGAPAAVVDAADAPRFKLNPDAATNIDEAIARALLPSLGDRHTQKTWKARCCNSGSLLLRLLAHAAKNVSTGAGQVIELEMNDLMKVGLPAATVEAFGEFFNEYCLKNDSLPDGSVLPPSVVAARMITAVVNLGDVADNKLAIELAGQDRSDLDTVTNAIRVVLSDLTARDRQKQLLSGKGGGLSASDPRRDVTHPALAPRADGYVKPTSWSTGMRPCKHCLGQHIDDACKLSADEAAKVKAETLRKQKRNQSKKAKAKLAKSALIAAAGGSPAPAPAPAASGGANVALGATTAGDDALSELFSGDAPRTIELGRAGGANMARGSATPSARSHDGMPRVPDGRLASPGPPAPPSAASAGSRRYDGLPAPTTPNPSVPRSSAPPTTPHEQAKLAQSAQAIDELCAQRDSKFYVVLSGARPGVCYGTWGKPDLLCDFLSSPGDPTSCVTYETTDLSHALELCHESQMPSTFLGPRLLTGLTVGEEIEADHPFPQRGLLDRQAESVPETESESDLSLSSALTSSASDESGSLSDSSEQSVDHSLASSVASAPHDAARRRSERPLSEVVKGLSRADRSALSPPRRAREPAEQSERSARRDRARLARREAMLLREREAATAKSNAEAKVAAAAQRSEARRRRRERLAAASDSSRPADAPREQILSSTARPVLDSQWLFWLAVLPLLVLVAMAGAGLALFLTRDPGTPRTSLSSRCAPCLLLIRVAARPTLRVLHSLRRSWQARRRPPGGGAPGQSSPRTGRGDHRTSPISTDRLSSCTVYDLALSDSVNELPSCLGSPLRLLWLPFLLTQALVTGWFALGARLLGPGNARDERAACCHWRRGFGVWTADALTGTSCRAAARALAAPSNACNALHRGVIRSLGLRRSLAGVSSFLHDACCLLQHDSLFTLRYAWGGIVGRFARLAYGARLRLLLPLALVHLAVSLLSELAGHAVFTALVRCESAVRAPRRFLLRVSRRVSWYASLSVLAVWLVGHWCHGNTWLVTRPPPRELAPSQDGSARAPLPPSRHVCSSARHVDLNASPPTYRRRRAARRRISGARAGHCFKGHGRRGRVDPCVQQSVQQRSIQQGVKASAVAYATRLTRFAAAMVGATTIDFAIDSGSTWHLHHRRSDFVNLRSCSDTITGIDGKPVRASGVGDLPIVSMDSSGRAVRTVLRSVRWIPEFQVSLLSVDQLWDSGGTDTHFRDRCCISLSDGTELPFRRAEGLYLWSVAGTANCSATAISAIDSFHALVAKAHSPKAVSFLQTLQPEQAAELLHRRLHIGSDRLRRLPLTTSDIPEGAVRASHGACASCLEANAPRHAHPSKSYKPSYPGRLIHADIAGPFVRSAHGHYQYLLMLTDDHSRFKVCLFMQRKSEAPALIRRFVATFEALVNKNRTGPAQSIGALHCDNAGEFLSREFKEFLDESLISQTTCPPHVHQLNGVAERSIRTTMEAARAHMVAANAPIGFWNYAVSHAVDISNRTSGPPDSDKSSYEHMTGEQPRVLGIMPFGCRSFAVKPRSEYSKTRLESRAWTGTNLGRSATIPGAYSVWLPDLGKVVTTSDVYFDECLMPWRKPGDQRYDLARPAGVDDPDHGEQPPGMPAIGPRIDQARERRAAPPSAAASSLPEALDLAVRSPSAIARRSTRVLLLYSGPYKRPDGLASFLSRLGLQPELVDSDPIHGGGDEHDMLNDDFYEALLRRASLGEFLAVVAAPPCSTFSVSRFFESPDSPDGGAPIVRDRDHPAGLPGAPEVEVANLLVDRTAALLAAAAGAGTQFVVENPSDRGDASEQRIFLDARHAPVWLLPSMSRLRADFGARYSIFSMCMFGAPYQKYTTIMYSPGLEPSLAPFDRLRCLHDTHVGKAGGSRDATTGEWNSRSTAAYPADLNLHLAQAIGSLRDTSPPKPPAAVAPPRRPAAAARPSDDDDDAAQPGAAPLPARAPLPSEPPPTVTPSPPPEPPLGPGISVLDDAPPTEPIAPPAARKPRRKPAEIDHSRGSRIGTRASGVVPISGAMLVLGSSLGHSLHVVGSALGVPTSCGSSRKGSSLKASSVSTDPRSHDQAMLDDRPGWTKAENTEYDNHEDNESWRRIDRSKVPRGRKLIKLVWAYKRKRSGRLKARLCVQGCAQRPGVDYDQTYCSTMRASSLRALSSAAAKLGLRMRRWDFVAAYLQGNLLEDEVVYCLAPQGHSTKGADGRAQVLRVQKPIYGMAQAGRRWQRSIYPWLESQGFEAMVSDASVFVRRETVDTPTGPRDETIMLGCYVDDLFVLYSHDDVHSSYTRFSEALQERWDVEDEGEVKDLLNVEISREDGCVILRQSGYIDHLVETYLPNGLGRAVRTPADEDLPVRVDAAVAARAEPAPELLASYQSIVGALNYAATHTRPDIAYAVGRLSRCMSYPTPELMADAERVITYLHRTRHIGLRYEADDLPVSGFSDSDWALKHSTSGHVFQYQRAAISWGSKKQATIALSSCEAEIVAASDSAKEAVYLGSFLTELGLHDGSPVALGVDNQAARDLSYNPQHHERTKHILRRHFWIRELVEDNRIVVPLVSTDANLADFFTKPLPPRKFVPMRNKIMNFESE